MPDQHLQPLAIEFDVSDIQSGKIGNWNVNPINWLNELKKATEPFKVRVETDLLGQSKVIIRKHELEGLPTEITLSDKLKELCDAKPNDFIPKETQRSNGEVTHLTFENAMKCLTQEYQFSERNAELTLAACTQGGFGGGTIFTGNTLNGLRLILDIDKNNNLTLKTSASEFNYADHDALAERKEKDLLTGKCPSKNDIFVNASIYMGRVDDEPQKLTIKATLASRGQDGIESIQELAGQNLHSSEKDFQGEKDLCLSRLVKFIEPEKLVEEWVNRIQPVDGVNKVWDLEVSKHFFKKENLPIIAQMVALKDHQPIMKEEEIARGIMKNLEKNPKSIVSRMRAALTYFSGKSRSTSESAIALKHNTPGRGGRE